MLRHIAAALILTVTANVATAQTLISRSALDSLVRPALSKIASGALSVDSLERHIGKVKDGERVSVSYRLRNTLDKPITITSIRPSCSCLSVESKDRAIAAKGSYIVDVELNTEGRSGAFSYDVNIYTSLDTSRPIVRLTLKGEVENTDLFSHLTHSMGTMRMSRGSVTLEGVTPSATRRERIAIANSGSTAIRPTAHPTIKGLSLRCEPEVLAPGQEGDMIIEYRPTAEPSRDIETMVVVEGVEASAVERIIRITLKR